MMVKTEFFIWVLVLVDTGTHLCQATYMILNLTEIICSTSMKNLDNLPFLGWVVCSTVNETNICL